MQVGLYEILTAESTTTNNIKQYIIAITFIALKIFLY